MQLTCLMLRNAEFSALAKHLRRDHIRIKGCGSYHDITEKKKDTVEGEGFSTVMLAAVAGTVAVALGTAFCFLRRRRAHANSQRPEISDEIITISGLPVTPVARVAKVIDCGDSIARIKTARVLVLDEQDPAVQEHRRTAELVTASLAN